MVGFWDDVEGELKDDGFIPPEPCDVDADCPDDDSLPLGGGGCSSSGIWDRTRIKSPDTMSNVDRGVSSEPSRASRPFRLSSKVPGARLTGVKKMLNTKLLVRNLV